MTKKSKMAKIVCISKMKIVLILIVFFVFSLKKCTLKILHFLGFQNLKLTIDKIKLIIEIARFNVTKKFLEPKYGMM